MTPYEEIRLAGATLSSGESMRGICPWCHGGRSKEESFVVTRKGGDLMYVCHRASCTGRSNGVLSISGNPTKLRPVKEKEREHALTCATYPISQEVAAELRDRFQFIRPVIEYYGLVQSKEGDVIIPIYNSRGLVQGHERRVREPGKAKAIRYNGIGADGMGWYSAMPTYGVPNEYLVQEYRGRRYTDECLFVVEDLYSAMKVNAFSHSLALLGTAMSPEKAAAIATMQYERVFLALDKDATAKAAALVRRYRGILPELQVVPLERDIKDMSYNLIAKMLQDNMVRN